MGLSSNQALAGAALLIVAVIGGGYAFSTLADDPVETPTEDMVNTEEVTIDGVVPIKTDIADGTAYLFQEQPDTGAPTYFGDFAEFDEAEATSGLTEGVDYHQTDIDNADRAVFEDLDPGTYHLAVVDNSDPQDFHFEFGQVTMPDQVSELIYSEEGEVEIYDDREFIRTAVTDVDSATTFDAAGEAVSLSANIDAPDEDVEDRERTVEREVELESGQLFIGELELDEIVEKDAVDEMIVTVEADGGQVHQEDFADLVDDDTRETVELGASDDPVTAEDAVTVTVDLMYDAAEEGTTSDTMIEDGETIVEVGVEDIYGDGIGTDDPLVITG